MERNENTCLLILPIGYIFEINHCHKPDQDNYEENEKSISHVSIAKYSKFHSKF